MRALSLIHIFQRLGVVVVLGVDAVLVLGLGAGDTAKRAVVAAQLGAAGGIIGDRLGNNILCPGQRRGSIWDLVVEVVRGGLLGVKCGCLLYTSRSWAK